ncbi:hypothetical protein BZZ01_19010 [Nostocales cyanobacterium HT-58-2]|nr:hypothetical protein BZZ01_19010 [Nostocales cyanobacterium HT-58-2]
MRYSLVSRFQGTLLGAFLGEKKASNSTHQLQGAEKLQVASLHWIDMAILCAESLISLGRFDTEDWRKRQQPKHTNLENSYCAILATLPVVLSFHENTMKLRQNLLIATEIWHNDPEVRDGILAVGYAIAQSLTEKLNPATVISQTISFVGETSTNLPQQLLKVHSFLENGTRLEKVQTELSKEENLTNAIALAFYCFLSTTEDFRLSVLRAIQKNHRLPGIGAIAGALSGAYNSTVGIPVSWQVMLLQAKPEECSLADSSRMLELADALVAVWSGVYHLTSHPDEVTEQGSAIAPHLEHLQAIAAPRVIRSR